MVLWSNWMLIINEWQLFIQSVSELAESTLDCWPGSEGWGSRWDRESTWDCRRQSHQHECSPLWSAPTTVRAIMPPFNAQCNQRQKWVKFAQDNQPLQLNALLLVYYYYSLLLDCITIRSIRRKLLWTIQRGLSACPSVCWSWHCKNGQTDRDAVWGGIVEPKEPCIWWGLRSPH